MSLLLGFVLLLAGGVLIDAGVTGSSLASVVKGAPDHASGATTSTLASGTPANVTPTAGQGGASVVGGPQQQQVTAEVNRLAARYGWDQQQVQAWLGIIQRESGFNPTIANPGTTAAYGLGQFFAPAPGNPILPRAQQIALNKQKYRDYGGNPNTIAGQLVGMANYIKQNWGTPANAYAHEQTSTY